MPFLAILLSLIIWGLIWWILNWLLGAAAIPEPFNKVAQVVLAVAAVVIVIGLLTGSVAPFYWLRGMSV